MFYSSMLGGRRAESMDEKGGRLDIGPETLHDRPTGIPTVARGLPVCIVVHVPDADALGAEMERHGFRVRPAADGHDVALGDDRLSIRTSASNGLLEVGPCDGSDEVSDAGAPSGRLLAIGLATVDHERFARDHGLGTLEVGPHDDLLGAWSWRRAGLERLVLLEPSTEGRLAGALARAGEGPLVVYLSPGDASGPDIGSPTALGVPGVLVRLPGRLAASIIVV